MVLGDRPISSTASSRVLGLPPCDIAAEEAVLAAVMLDAEQCAEEGVFGMLESLDFFREQNGWAYRAARDVHERGETVTPVTVAHELDRAGIDWTPEDGWLYWLTDIYGKYFTAVGASAHARIVAADAYYRRLIAAASQIAQLAYEGGTDYQRVQMHAEQLIAGLRLPGNVISASHRFRGGVSLEYVEEANG